MASPLSSQEGDMGLVALAEELLCSARAYAKCSRGGDSAVVSLRDDIRAQTKKIALKLDGPEQTLRSITRGFTVSSILRVMLDIQLAEKMSLAGAYRLDELEQLSRCHGRILRPSLRLLAQHGIFRQDADGLWRHTDMSSLIASPPYRAWMTSILTEKYKSVSHLPDSLKLRDYGAPGPGTTAFNDVYSTPLDFYTFSSQADLPAALNFATSMEELARDQLPFFDLSYPLQRLAADSHFVDVAGGLGNFAFHIAEKFPLATFTVQDFPYIIQTAIRMCPTEMKDRVQFVAHDMLLPQPKLEREEGIQVVFLLKIILHDHVDAECKVILGNILAAMFPADRLLIVDTVISEVGGTLSSSFSDVIILSMFGSGHRTLSELKRLIKTIDEHAILETFTDGARAEADGLMVIEVRKG